VRINQIPASTNIGQMMVSGALDATLLYLNDRNAVDRSRVDLDAEPSVAFLFADPAAECRRYYAKTRLHPINHTLVVRRDVAERDPTLARRIFDAFVAAKADARRTAAGVLQPYFDTGQMDGSAAQAFANDPMAYGVRPNRRILETVAGYVQRQGLLARPVALEEVFAPEMLDV
jgi:4,5-dihydroxyphthalate decarboxylase